MTQQDLVKKRYNQSLTLWGFLWGLPVTLVGVAAALLSVPSLQLRGGMIMCKSTKGLAYILLARRGVAAITLGRILIVTHDLSPHLWHHEIEHARQAERWGILLIPLYLINQARFGYRQNPFEVAAREVEDEFKANSPNVADQLVS